MTRTFDLLLVGFGHVGQRFAALLDERRDLLQRDFGFTTRIVAVATGRHGRIAIRPGGGGGTLAAASLAAAVNRGERLSSDVDPQTTAEFVAYVARHSEAARDGRLVVVETTTLDIGRGGQPAIEHVRAALANGAHVVTANKGPVAFAYRELAETARQAGRAFLFEGAVMDGVPIFNLVRETLPGVAIAGFRGVVNATTNHILTEMEQGESFDEALAAMQAAGIAEADASLDVDGWDAAAKTAALANVLLGAKLTPNTVERQGIDRSTPAAAARQRGRRLKLVARAARVDGDRVEARVAVEDLPESDLLAGLEGQQNAIILHTDLLGEIAIVQRGSGLTQTAYALLSDVITIARRHQASAALRARS